MPSDLKLSNPLNGLNPVFTAIEDGVWEVGFFMGVPSVITPSTVGVIIESEVEYPLNLWAEIGSSRNWYYS